MAQDEKQGKGAQQSLDETSGVDERLLARNDKKKNKERKRKAPKQQATERNSFSEFRRAMVLARREETKKKKIKKGKGPINPLKKATNSWLRMSWLSAIETFGLSLFYTNIHALFLRPIFGKKVFSDLGEEWTDGKIKSNKVGKAEKMLLGMLDLGCLLLIISNIVILVLIVAWYYALWETIKNIITGALKTVMENIFPK